MRRSMLTQRVPVAGLILGSPNPDAAASSVGNGSISIWATDDVAATNGTITTVRAKLRNFDGSTAYNIAFLTIDGSGVVRAISANISIAGGYNTVANHTVSLAAQTGDRIAMWVESTGRDWIEVYYESATGSNTYQNSTTTTKPVAGNSRVLTLQTSNRRLAIRGT